jgi:hypothetical protein
MKKLALIVTTLNLVLVVGACSSSTPKMDGGVVENFGQEKVISRIDDMSSRPSWLKESEPLRFEGGKVMSLGMTVIPADHNVSAAYRIAENNAKSSISHSIEQRLDYVFENAEEGTAMGASQARYIGSEASKLTTSSLRLSKRYWEKISTVQENGQPTLQYRVFALVEMPESDFKTAIVDAIRRSQGKQGISAEFAKKVDEHWSKFVNADVDQKSVDSRQPSTNDTTTSSAKADQGNE